MDFGRGQILGQIWPPNWVWVDLLVDKVFSYQGVCQSPPRSSWVKNGTEICIFYPGFLIVPGPIDQPQPKHIPSLSKSKCEKKIMDMILIPRWILPSPPFWGWDVCIFTYITISWEIFVSIWQHTSQASKNKDDLWKSNDNKEIVYLVIHRAYLSDTHFHIFHHGVTFLELGNPPI